MATTVARARSAALGHLFFGTAPITMARVKPFLFLFAHGAGAPSSHPWMRAWAARLATLGAVEAFDYPYMQGNKRAPDPQALLIRAHLAAIDQALARHP